MTFESMSLTLSESMDDDDDDDDELEAVTTAAEDLVSLFDVVSPSIVLLNLAQSLIYRSNVL